MDIRQIDWQTYGETVLNPVTFILTILMGLAVLVIKREYAVIPYIIIACFITNMQRIVIFDLDFPMLRIMVGFGILRLIFRKDVRSFKFNIVDKLMISWIVVRCITHTILWKDMGAFIETAGFLVDSLGVYLIMRMLLYDISDTYILFKALAVCSVIVSVFMFYEQMTGRNFFSFLGGVPEYTLVREGKLRSQGAFSHAIMAGTFGASLTPLMWSMWNNKYKLYALLGLISGLIITYTSSSSGPVLTLMACFIGMFLWKFRMYIKRIIQGGVLIIIGLHIVMKQPVWHLICRIDITGGSTGWHRFMLIDQTIKRFTEWALFGAKYPGSWGWGLQDLTNMFVFEAVNGGIIPVILFVMIIRHSFKSVGQARLAVSNNLVLNKDIWLFGSVLFAHVVSFIGVAYFGQMIFFFFLLIAIISSLNNFPSIVNSAQLETA